MPTRRPRRLALLAVPAALLLLVGAACSDDDSSGTDDPTVTDGGSGGTGATTTSAAGGTDDGGQAVEDPCALVTAAQLQDAFGSPWDEGEATQQAETGGSQCTWTNSDAPPVKNFTLVVYTTESLRGTDIGQATDDAAGYYEVNKAASTVDEDLDIGDEAFRAGSTVWVLDGDTLYSFSAFLGDGDASEGVVDVATQAVDG